MQLSGTERFFDRNEIIVSKTDLKGSITYCNQVCNRIADYAEGELIGKPHSILRHDFMPRCVFKLLWDEISEGREVFAYVVNKTKYADYYWVLAHVTPSYGQDGAINGYHSNRRVPDAGTVKNVIMPLYQALRNEEARHKNAKEGLASSSAMLSKILSDKGVSYDEFIFSL